jgi:HSP20 family molecular chaperone IbpA
MQTIMKMNEDFLKSMTDAFDLLRTKGPQEAVPASLQLSHAEVRAPWFSRRFTVSEDFDTPRIEAALKDGVLKLTIPRRDEAKPRHVEVKVG